MSDAGTLEEARRGALDRVDRAERSYRLTFLAAAAVESAFLVGYLLLADLSNRMHVLLRSRPSRSTRSSRSASRSRRSVKRCTLRILKAIELTREGSRSG